MASQPPTLVTPEEYLEREYISEFKNQYLNGEIFAVAGADFTHLAIVANVSQGLGTQQMYTYPDVVVIYGKPDVSKDKGTETIANPSLVVEVLSPTTERYDRGLRFEHYRNIAALQECWLVSQDKVMVERFVKQAGGDWKYSATSTLDETIPLTFAPASLKVADIYEDVFLKSTEESE